MLMFIVLRDAPNRCSMKCLNGKPDQMRLQGVCQLMFKPRMTKHVDIVEWGPRRLTNLVEPCCLGWFWGKSGISINILYLDRSKSSNCKQKPSCNQAMNKINTEFWKSSNWMVLICSAKVTNRKFN
jgi:hypothetical protein